jgi:hypothetical protein
MTRPAAIGRSVTRCVAIAVAVCLACQLAWGRSFPPLRTVVVQVESCELAVLVGYRPASGEATDTMLARIGSSPKGQQLETAKSLLGQQAMAALTFSIDGKPLVPTSVRAKLGTDPGGTRPLVVVLVTFAIPHQGTLAVTSKDPRSTRISWTDRDSHRVDHLGAPAQGRLHSGVASFLLSLTGPPGDSCASSQSSTH